MSFATNKFVVLARREYWEHRMLWMAPVIVGVIMLVLPLVAGINREGPGAMDFNPGDDPAAFPVLAAMFGQATMIGTVITLGGIAALVVLVYLLDCLYGERKDRSILFWKSLPVSDVETVVTKVVVALVLTPWLIGLLALIVQPLLLGVMALRVPAMAASMDMSSVWEGWRILPEFAMAWLFAVLWYLPLTAWLLLASVLAKRVPLMYAAMPPVALIIIEGVVLGGNSVAKFVGQYLFPWVRVDWEWDPSRGMLPGLGAPDWPARVSNPSLWICAAIGLAAIYAVIRLRRYRDDT